MQKNVPKEQIQVVLQYYQIPLEDEGAISLSPCKLNSPEGVRLHIQSNCSLTQKPYTPYSGACMRSTVAEESNGQFRQIIWEDEVAK